ncbi:hypothetical protein FRC03_010838 [Tulasnella sp. 419]|nr:hypothetical protein FRC03_010838 [Tulasnella sp. 419]
MHRDDTKWVAMPSMLEKGADEAMHHYARSGKVVSKFLRIIGCVVVPGNPSFHHPFIHTVLQIIN